MENEKYTVWFTSCHHPGLLDLLLLQKIPLLHCTHFLLLTTYETLFSLHLNLWKYKSIGVYLSIFKLENKAPKYIFLEQTSANRTVFLPLYWLSDNNLLRNNHALIAFFFHLQATAIIESLSYEKLRFPNGLLTWQTVESTEQQDLF